MIFVIDNVRGGLWKQLTPPPVVIGDGSPVPETLAGTDYVFAHTPTDFDLDGPAGAPNGRTGRLPAVEAFRQVVVRSVWQGTPPTLVLYSGEDRQNLAPEADWKRDVNARALPDFPQNRILVFPSAVSRTCHPAYLQRVVTWAADHSAEIVSGSVRTPDAADLDTPDADDRILALKFLCEAWECVYVRKEADVGGIPVRAPVSASDWFAPFEMRPDEQNARLISDMMPPVNRGPALKLLRTVLVGGDLTAAVAGVLWAAAGTTPTP